MVRRRVPLRWNTTIALLPGSFGSERSTPTIDLYRSARTTHSTRSDQVMPGWTISTTAITISTLRWTPRILRPGSKNKKCVVATSRIAGSLKFGTMQDRRCRDLAVRSFFTFDEDQLDLPPAARPWLKAH